MLRRIINLFFRLVGLFYVLLFGGFLALRLFLCLQLFLQFFCLFTHPLLLLSYLLLVKVQLVLSPLLLLLFVLGALCVRQRDIVLQLELYPCLDRLLGLVVLVPAELVLEVFVQVHLV